MLKSSKLGDSVASDMDRILNDPSFKSVFEPEAVDYSNVINQDPNYQAFVRVAKKHEDDDDKKEDKKEDKKGKNPFAKLNKEKEDKKEDKKKDKKEDKKDKKDKKEDKKDKKAKAQVDYEVKAQAIQYIVQSLITTSEALDNMGLEKSATVALGLLNGILKEAQAAELKEDPSLLSELSERVEGFEDDSEEEGSDESTSEKPKHNIFAPDTNEEYNWNNYQNFYDVFKTSPDGDGEVDIEYDETGAPNELFLADDKKEKKDKDDKDSEDDKKDKDEGKHNDKDKDDDDGEEDDDDEEEDKKDKNDLVGCEITDKKALALMNEIQEWIKK